MKPKISVCLVTRNDEERIVSCLKSARPVASEIIVMDLASTDKTVKLAKKYGSVYHSKPVNDLSSVRNLCLKKATGDWILFLEPDDVLSQETQASLTAFISEQKTLKPDIFYFKIFHMQPKGFGSYITFRPVLFRNNQEIRYNGSAFEYPVKPNGEITAGKLHFLTILNFEGIRPPAEVQQKIRSDLAKIPELIEKNKNNFYYFYQQGNAYNRLTEFYKAVDSYRQAYKMFKETKDNRQDLFADLLIRLASTLGFCTGNYQEGTAIVQELLKISPGFPDALFFKGFCAQNMRNINQAIRDYETLLEKIKKPSEEINPLGLTSLESSLIPLTLLQLGKCFKAGGNQEKALEMLESAGKYAADNPDITMQLIKYHLLENNLPAMLNYYFRSSPQTYTEKEKTQMKEVAKLSPITMPFRHLQLKFLRSLENLEIWSEEEKQEIKDKIEEVSKNIL